jgi:serine/threonine protein kinase
VTAESTTAAVPLQPDFVLSDRFTLVRQLGSGAVGTVWLARDEMLDGEEVACKFLLPELADSAEAVADLKRELLLARKLRHPGIVGLHTFWAAGGHRFITMEYVDGADLGSLLHERETPYSVTDVLPWTEQICEALTFAHRRGVLHRDVKPSNILLDSHGDIRIADFGIACTAQEALARDRGRATSGTLLFMSPEQLMAEPIDGRTDLYSVAASLYELLSGMPPFHTGSIVAQIQFTPVAPIPSLPDSVNKVLLKALSKKPQDRHLDLGSFFEDFAFAAAVGAGESLLRMAKAAFIERSDPNQATVQLENAPLDRLRLGAILVEAGAITQVELNHALDRQRDSGKRVGELLVETNIIGEDAIANALERQLHIAREAPMRGDIDPAVATRHNRDWIGAGCLPMRIDDDRVVTAMTDPLDFDVINEVESAFGIPVDPRIATQSELDRVWEALAR